jgi:hypothetical protein
VDESVSTPNDVCVRRANPGSGDGDRHGLPAIYAGAEGGASGDADPRAVPAAYPGSEGRPDTASFSLRAAGLLWMRRASDETAWQIGGSDEVAWIATNTRPGRTIATAIPPFFDAYATVTVPGPPEDKRLSDEALLALLRAQEPQQPWWLGYLETGASDVVFSRAPRVQLYRAGPMCWSGLDPNRRPPGERTTMRRRGTARYQS